MRQFSLLSLVLMALGLSVQMASPVAAGPIDLDMWATPVDARILGYAAGTASDFASPIVGPNSGVFGNVSRRATVSQPNTVPNSNPSPYGTETFTSPSGMALTFNAHDSYGQLALDYRFGKATTFNKFSLEVRNTSTNTFTLALFIAKSPENGGIMDWTLASDAPIDGEGPSAVLEEYSLPTNHSGKIYGVMVVYNPLASLLAGVPASKFSSLDLSNFTSNQMSIETELCCVTGIPEPSSVLLGLVGFGLLLSRSRLIKKS